MAGVRTVARDSSKPRLLFFYSERDGRARRIEGYLAQVLQRRQNHETFQIHRIEVTARPDLRARFHVDGAPSLVVIEDRTLRGRLDAPTSAKRITEFLEPWLR